MHTVFRGAPQRLCLALLGGAVLALAGTGVASAATYTVNSTTDSATPCTGSGTCSLRGAVIAADTAGGSNTIDVPAGQYKLTITPTGSDDQTSGDLNITSGTNVTIVGAGSDATILSGDGTSRLFAVEGGGSLSLSGATLRQGNSSSDGYPTSGSGYQDGGAVYTEGGLTVTGDVLFKDNTSTAGEYGGAIYAANSSQVKLTGATFENNSSYDGGAVYDASTSSLSITDSSFSSNTGKDDAGGAIYGSSAAGALNVTNTTFTADNSYAGGAIYWDGSSGVTVQHSTFNGDSSDGEECEFIFCFGAGTGGAINDVGSSGMTLTYDSFINDSATANGGALDLGSGSGYTLDHDLFKSNSTHTESGGAVAWYDGTLSSSDSTYEDNSTYNGGALLADSGNSLTLINDTISDNTGYYDVGGGLSVATSTPASLINDTITNNVADSGGGGGIYGAAALTTTGYSGSGTAGIENTVIADNNGGDCDSQFSSPFDLGHNMDSDGSCFSGSTDLANMEPHLGRPADNGGPLVGNASDGSAVVIPTEAETSASPTVDAGTNTNCPSTDERGVTRPQGATCDIGAFELAAAKLAVRKTAPRSVLVHGVFTYTIRVTNSGPGYSTGTTLTDRIPSSESLKAISPSAGVTCTHSGRAVSCKIGDLRSGGHATVRVLVKANRTGTVRNTASAVNNQGSKASGHASTRVGAAKAAKVRRRKKSAPVFTG